MISCHLQMTTIAGRGRLFLRAALQHRVMSHLLQHLNRSDNFKQVSVTDTNDKF